MNLEVFLWRNTDIIFYAFPEVSLAAKLLMELLDDPVEARMAYELLEECRS